MKIKFEVDVTEIVTDIVNYTDTEYDSAKLAEIKEDLRLDLKESFKKEILKQIIPRVNVARINEDLKGELYQQGLEAIKEHSDKLFNEPSKESLIQGISLEFFRAFKEEFYRRVVQEFKQDPNVLQEIIKGMRSEST